ncbi:MAG: glutamate-1-semialdehyde 2,1-aminomutase [Clostridia bacterium]|nr:glutamate-1-semialdehyde 2,1-aminomutase [Clostridia bacterium]
MGKTFEKSRQLYTEALQYIPGGVNSPVRAFKAVGQHPLFIVSGLGSRLQDVDGNEYIDYVGSWGPLILGHRHPRVIGALQQYLAEAGTGFGAPTRVETELARIINRAFPSMELVRMVNSGTEATMSALRVARAYTGRQKILKFKGCYHGHHDSLLIEAGSGALTIGVPSSPGVPASFAADTITCDFNDLRQVRAVFSQMGQEIAAVIVEPVPGNMGVVLPQPGFLEGLREITRQFGAVLIFDEVMTGFRCTWGGAQHIYNIEPDLTCLGKIIGGGLPVGAYGGKRQIMELVAPLGPVYQAGTLAGNPLAMTAGLVTLQELEKPGTYEKLNHSTQTLAQGLREAAAEAGLPVQLNSFGSMLTCFFTGEKVVNYQSALNADTRAYKHYFQAMLLHGVYLAPSQFEACFVSLAHSQEDLDDTIAAAQEAFREIRAMQGSKR